MWGAFLAACLLSASSLAGILNSQEQAIFDRLATSGQNRPFVVVDPVLTQVARARAADMAHRHYYAHVNPDGHGPNYMVRQSGYKLPDWWGTSDTDNYVESIAAGDSTSGGTWNEWMNSPPHKKHLLGEDDFYKGETSVGVGYAEDSNSDWGYYWVVITAPPQPLPSLSITSPAGGAQTTSPAISFTGKTAGSTVAKTVLYRIENSTAVTAFQPATGTTNWSMTVNGLAPGPNTVRIRSVDAYGKTIAEVARNVIYLLLTPLTVTIEGDGAITPNWLGTTSCGLGMRYTLTATPKPGSLFAGWSGTASTKASALTFLMVEGCALKASFIPNPFLTRKGDYQGLLQGDSEGALQLTVGGMGGFSGKLRVDGQVYLLTGRMAADGTATLKLPGAKTLSLQLDVAGETGLTGSLSGSMTAEIRALPAYRAASGPHPAAGRYTVSLPPDPANTSLEVPQGDGYGILVLTKTGLARLTGNTADGEVITLVAPVSMANTISFYLPMYSRGGSIAGTLTLRPTAGSDLDGTLHWSKPWLAAARIKEAFTANLPVTGSRYTPPAPGSTVVSVAAGQDNSALTLTDGSLLQTVVQPATLDTLNRITPSGRPLDNLWAKIDPATGRFWGSFIHPVSKKVSKMSGVIFQKKNAGFGYFLGSDQTGYTGGYTSLTSMQ